MDDHVVGEEAMDRFHYGSRNDLTLGVIAIEVKARKDAQQQLVEILTVVKCPNLLEDCRTDPEGLSLHPHLLVHQVGYNRLDLLHML